MSELRVSNGNNGPYYAMHSPIKGGRQFCLCSEELVSIRNCRVGSRKRVFPFNVCKSSSVNAIYLANEMQAQLTRAFDTFCLIEGTGGLGVATHTMAKQIRLN